MMWLDVGLIFLLMIAVGFCYRLSDRLQSLKGFTTVLAPSIERLTQVLNGANQAIGYLKQATETSQKGIETYIPNAQAISEDVVLLIEHADRISYRLDDLIVKAGEIEKNLRQTVLVSMRQTEKQAELNPEIQISKASDPRDLFVQRVISRYPKDAGVTHTPVQEQSQSQQ